MIIRPSNILQTIVEIWSLTCPSYIFFIALKNSSIFFFLNKGRCSRAATPKYIEKERENKNKIEMRGDINQNPQTA